MNRRNVIRTCVLGAAAVLTGCEGVPEAGGDSKGSDRHDSDSDGVPDGNDAAPNDPRVDVFVGGDPAPSVEFEPLADPNGRDTVPLRVTYTGGDPITTDRTDRLELAANGQQIGAVPLPFRAGDRHQFDAVPV